MKHRKLPRALSLVLVLALVVSLVGGALASSGTVTKALNYAGITLNLNGKAIDLKNEKGETVEPFAIDGTTYAPFRAIGDALGLYVGWDRAKSQILLSETPIPTGERKPVTFYIARHGETIFNERGIMQGWCDGPLTEEGQAQAISLGKGLEGIPFAAVYSSTSERAMDTANSVIATHPGLELQTSKNLREMNYGKLEGLSNTDPMMAEAGDVKYILAHGFDKVGGETWAQLGARMKGTLEEAAEAYTYDPDCQNIFVATHGMSIMALLMATLPPAEVQTAMAQISKGLDNCSVTTLEWNNGVWTLKGLNDISYRGE